ncbi:DUF2927 domain-containing protein [Paracoccus benzoatiresistens]|uniref:DUF2927 domain-containing protein n=1 Tax=Paracoccus benzoatiresistens TaxID=2997341 RepID=A0ABT4J3D8_9RHOB|nr:DUF2927 domain-containing protein [Paracoccus sp. EF6]MCZ0961641.1 DUF2927 domain-containing protein [Paracoccus sp. EF6]
MTAGRLRRWNLLPLLGLLAVAACGGPEPVPPVADTRPVVRPDPGPSQEELRKARAERNRAANAAAAEALVKASATSTAQRDFYDRAERALRAQGRLRRDRVPMDAPIDAETLTRNFIAVALRDEYGQGGIQAGDGGAPAPLRRWQDPVRLQIEFGTTSDVATRRSYRIEVSQYAARLAEATGHRVSLTDSGGNFVVMVLSDDERRAIGPRLAQLVPGIPAHDIAAMQDLDADNFCTVFAYSRGAAPVYSNAVALIRAELPPLLQSSCIHEELAQGMGLANDSPEARPSIFNDDEEFALLTRHDELLLKILYDPRLRPGMSAAEAEPVVRQIATELMAQNI